jgi:uncharacterized membrane protein
MEKFNKKEAIKYGWEKMKANFWFFVGALVILMFITAILNRIPAIGSLVGLLAGILNWGIIAICLKIYNNEEIKIKDLFSQIEKIIKYIGSTILYSAIVLGGLILLIVPGIMWAIKYQFMSYLIIEKDMGIMEALRKSGEITKGSRNNLFLFTILLGLINLVGALALGIGLFATIPTTMLAMVYVYKKLSTGSPSPEPIPQVVL